MSAAETVDRLPSGGPPVTPGAAAGWGIHRYGRPSVRFDDAFVDPDTDLAAVVAGGELYDIASPGAEPAAVVEYLSTLRRSANCWPSDTDPADWRRSVVRALDIAGLIEDLDDGAAAAEVEMSRLRATVAAAREWLESSGLVSQALVCGAAEVVRAAREPWSGVSRIIPPGSEHAGSFPLLALALRARYWRSKAPLSAAAVEWLLAVMIDEDVATAESTAGDLVGGEYDIDYSVDSVWGAAALIAMSARDDTAVRVTAQVNDRGRMSGPAHILAAEHVARQAVEDLGDRLHVAVMQAGEHPMSFVQGVFAEQYYVTARFVEAIAPLMSGRFRDHLRGRVYEYFDEERGHEVMERASCEALGVDHRQLDNYLPMPYFATFIDVYTLIADADPMAFLTSVMVSEGLPGDPYGINSLLGAPESYGERFAEQFRTHEGVNDDVDHALLARALFSDVPSVSVARHRQACEVLAFLMELTERAWEQLMEAHLGGEVWRYLPPPYGPRSLVPAHVRLP